MPKDADRASGLAANGVEVGLGLGLGLAVEVALELAVGFKLGLAIEEKLGLAVKDGFGLTVEEALDVTIGDAVAVGFVVITAVWLAVAEGTTNPLPPPDEHPIIKGIRRIPAMKHNIFNLFI